MESVPQLALVVGAALLATLAVATLVALLWRSRRGARVGLAVEQMAQAQAQMAGRLDQLAGTVDHRLADATRQLAGGLSDQSERTHSTLEAIQARLAVVDDAQRRIEELADEIVGLQDILSNKQARGAFGEVQLENLVRDCLPPSAYTFQATLGNGRRADCLLRLPSPPGDLVVDAKFPLESYHALVRAEGEAERKAAARGFAAAVRKHIADIAARYLVPGETADSALLFLPSEAVFAELHARFREVVEESYRARVWIVSPTTLMATLNTVRAVLRDARMREQAGRMQVAVRALLDDARRLDERFGDLGKHVAQAGEDLRLVRVSLDKLLRRAERIGEVDLGDEGPVATVGPAAPSPGTLLPEQPLERPQSGTPSPSSHRSFTNNPD